MTAAMPQDIAVNANNTDQHYVLWGNGRIDAVGGALPITGNAVWFDRVDQPVAVALHITDWATGAGYTLTKYGSVHPFNGAPAIPNGVFAGVPYTNGAATRYVDWEWNPNGNGQGYILDHYGQLWPFGGASAPPRAGRRWTWAAARKLKMRFTPDVRAITMDLYGGLHGDFAQADAIAPGGYWLGHDNSRDFVITTWAAVPSGYQLDLAGGVHSFGTAPETFGFPYRPGSNMARLLWLLSATDPMRLGEVWSGGQEFVWTSSTPPTVLAGGADPVSPATTVTGTTRPLLTWTYSDPQADAQTEYQLLVFSQTYVSGHNMADPLAWKADALVYATGVNRTTRGLASPVDLPNDTLRMYVRAKDSAGQWSAWSNRQWTQNVPAPATPTGLTAVSNYDAPVTEATAAPSGIQGPDQFSVSLSATTIVGGTANLVRFECSDDGGITWDPVRGADAVPLAATTTATDWDPPLGVARTYRAVAYATDPAVASLPSATASALIPLRTYVVTAVGNPALGGRLSVQEPVEWSLNIDSAVFWGLGAKFPTVVSAGIPESEEATLHVVTLNAAALAAVKGLIKADSDLVYRDPFGNVRYCRVVGSVPTALMQKAALDPHHTVDLPLVEVRPPHLEE